MLYAGRKVPTGRSDLQCRLPSAPDGVRVELNNRQDFEALEIREQRARLPAALVETSMLAPGRRVLSAAVTGGAAAARRGPCRQPPVALAASMLGRPAGCEPRSDWTKRQLVRQMLCGFASSSRFASSSAAVDAEMVVQDVQQATALLGETLRELDMLADASGDGGLATLPGPADEQHDRIAAQLHALRAYCEEEARKIGNWDGKRRGQSSAYKHHATVAPLHAQVLLATGKVRLMLPPPHNDVAGALQVTEAGFGALRTLIEAASIPPKEGRATQPAESALRAGRVHMLQGALQLAAARLRYAAEVAPQTWVAQGRQVIETLRGLLPEFEEAFGTESDEMILALQAVRQSYTEVGEAFFQGLGCEQSDEKAVQCCKCSRLIFLPHVDGARICHVKLLRRSAD